MTAAKMKEVLKKIKKERGQLFSACLLENGNKAYIVNPFFLDEDDIAKLTIPPKGTKNNELYFVIGTSYGGMLTRTLYNEDTEAVMKEVFLVPFNGNADLSSICITPLALRAVKDTCNAIPVDLDMIREVE